MSAANGFDLPSPRLIDLEVGAADIDAYNHVNNAVYVTWCDRIAWSIPRRSGCRSSVASKSTAAWRSSAPSSSTCAPLSLATSSTSRPRPARRD